tara:strand:- start:712 stop:1389 length:678 start_codon:yes stop_codon:yes gene_type:complete
MQVYLYCRNSCEHQTLSVEAQLDQLGRYASNQGYTIAGVFIDAAKSGATSLEERTGLQDALAALGKGDALLCLNQSRLARDTSIYFAIAAQVAKRKAKLLFANGCEHSDDPMAKMISGMMALIAELERATIKKRQKAAYAVMRKKGCALGNVKLNKQRYGFSVKDGLLIENHEEQKIIKVILSMRKENKKYRQIKEMLDKEGFYTRNGKSFHLGAICKIVKNNAA